MAARKQDGKPMDAVAKQLAIVIKHTRKLVPARPLGPLHDCDIAMHDWIVAWEQHRSLSTATGLAWRAWEYWGGLRHYLNPGVDHDDEYAADRAARRASTEALRLLGILPEPRA